MIYRILLVPPGYAPNERFMVAKYQATNIRTSLGRITDASGAEYFSTIEGARRALPLGARQLPYEPEHQFLELWEAAD